MTNRMWLHLDRLLRRPPAYEAMPSIEPSDDEVTEPSNMVDVKIDDDCTRENKESSSEEEEEEMEEEGDENDPLIEKGECRICQDEDSINKLETPCGCSGSLKVSLVTI